MLDTAPGRSLSHRDKLAIFALALAARIAAILALGPRRWRFGDALAYVRAAQALWRTGTYPSYTDLLLFRPPGYPAFLALSTAGHPDAIVYDKIVNAILGALSGLVLASIALRVFRSRRVARIAGVLAALHPGFLILSADIQSEPLFLLLLLCSGFLLLVAVDRPSSGCGAAAGAALAFAALTRPWALALAPILGAPLLDRRFPAAIRRVLAGSALFGFALVLLPWTIRNAIRFGAFLPVSDGGGMALYQGHSDWAVRYARARDSEERRQWGEDFNRGLAGWSNDAPGARDLNPGVRARALRRAAVRWARAHPREETMLLATKFRDWIRPWADPGQWGIPIAIATGVWCLGLALLAIRGALDLDRVGVGGVAAAVLVISVLVHLATIVSIRYRFVAWDPVIVLYAAAGLGKSGHGA